MKRQNYRQQQISATMGDLTLVKMLLRAVLQPFKDGLPIRKLDSEYRQCNGSSVPYKQFGFNTQEDFLHSVKDTVRFSRNKDGEMICFAVVTEETAHIAKLISNQKSKKRKPTRKKMTTYRKPQTSGNYSNYGSRNKSFQMSRFGQNTSFMSSPSRPVYNGPVYPRWGPAAPQPLMSKRIAQPGAGSGEAPSRFRSKSPNDMNNKWRDSNQVQQQQPPQPRPSASTWGRPITNQRPIQRNVAVPDFLVDELHTNFKSLLHCYVQKKGIVTGLMFNTLPSKNGFISSVRIHGQTFGCNQTCPSKKAAENLAAKNACIAFDITADAVEKMKAPSGVRPKTKRTKATNASRGPSFQDMNLDGYNEDEFGPIISSRLTCSADLETVKSRVRDLVATKPNGLFATRLEVMYKEQYNEVLPDRIEDRLEEWMDIVKMENPVGAKNTCILYPVLQSTISVTNNSYVFANEKTEIPPPRVPGIGESVQVFLSLYENCQEFYVHRRDSNIDEIMAAISDIYDKRASPKCLQTLVKGTYCVAQYSMDQQWYRAQILSTRTSAKFEPEAEVLFIDYGNTEYRPKDKLKRILKNICSFPVQAIKCSLFGILPKEGHHEQPCTSAIEELVGGGDKPLKMEFVEITDETCEVKVWNSDRVLINDELVKRGLVKVRIVEPDLLEIPQKQFIDVFVSHIKGTTEVIVRLVGEKFSDLLDDLEVEMSDYYRSNKYACESSPSVGSVYAAMLNDGVVSRIKVISRQGDGVVCYFLDHGDTDTIDVKQIFPIKPQFNTLSYQAVTCSLAGLEDFNEKDSVIETLIQILLNKTFIAEVLDRSDRLSVLLYDTSTAADVNVNDLITNTVNDEEFSPVLPEEGGILEVVVTHVADNGLIHVQIANHPGIKRLDLLMQDIEKHFSKPSRADEYVKSPRPGLVVVARYSVDNSWYRAEIKQIFTDRTAEVYFVDYGNSEVVDFTELRVADNCGSHMTLPYQALECVMYGVPPADGVWTSKAVTRLKELIQTDEEIPIKVASKATDTSPTEVSFFILNEADNDYISVGQTLLDDNDLFVYDDVSDEEVAAGVDAELVAEALSKVELDDNDNRLATVVSPPISSAETTPARQVFERRTPTSSLGSTPAASHSRERTPTSSVCSTPAASRSRERICSGEMSLPDSIDLPEDEFVEVHVMWSCDPGNFTCVLFENLNALILLMQEIKDFYTSPQCIYTDMPHELEPRSQLYAAQFEGIWYRVMIKSVLIASSKASALFVDFGDYNLVNLEDIRPLYPSFRLLPRQAFRAGLFGVTPLGDKWSPEAERRFSELTLDKDLLALVRQRLDDKILISLVDTSSDDDICIDEVLLNEGLVGINN
ncbi:tudor domain-containing protein 7B-like [Tubulanus polymorphus]|uniref:tudor domain-containing protein 7B-like n=1 Tax=Tubulanus polymorphus TaxID=672921 RepID=UPI003DA501C8